MSDHSELKRKAEAVTPQNFDSAEEMAENGYIECPHCGGQGEVELEADYCNYDGAAIGVQFYGIGHEFGAAEEYYRAANPAAILALIAENAALRKDAERYRFLRQQHWNDSEFAVVCQPKKALKLGFDCPSKERLDAAIDKAKGD